ncbi:hypothetical protein NQZ68_003750 [Dissostichus eleginoides]|nr:hypothetical protein NQZ68_003750 [Dissostichus eleginoides]
MVQFVTTYVPEPDTTQSEVSFQQARSEITFTHHPHIEISSEKTVLATTSPMMPSEESSQHFEPSDVISQTAITPSSLKDKTAQSEAPMTNEVSTDARVINNIAQNCDRKERRDCNFPIRLSKVNCSFKFCKYIIGE